MGFCFKRNESVPTGMKRLASERIEAALQSLKDGPKLKSVHAVRKDIKQARAVLRLARKRIPKKIYRRNNQLLRKAADQLAPTRDAYVKRAALQELGEQFHLRDGVLLAIREQLQSELTRARKQLARKKSARR